MRVGKPAAGTPSAMHDRLVSRTNLAQGSTMGQVSINPSRRSRASGSGSRPRKRL
jgi:hypothetical protein